VADVPARHAIFCRRRAGGVARLDGAGRAARRDAWVAAAVVFRGPPGAGLAVLLDDSKKLTAARRDAAFAALQEAAAAGALEFGIGAASAAEIGRLNILQATWLAMRRALLRLGPPPILALVDGNAAPPLPCPVRTVVGGDARSLSIAAAVDPCEGHAGPRHGAARPALAGLRLRRPPGLPDAGAPRGADPPGPLPPPPPRLLPVDQATSGFS
jgi:ribonuclease HII